jgi:hypothetical protein
MTKRLSSPSKAVIGVIHQNIAKIINRLLKKSGFVIARSGATKQSALSSAKNEIASLPLVARNDICPVFQHPVNTKPLKITVRPELIPRSARDRRSELSTALA